MAEGKNSMIEIGGLWVNKSKAGKGYMSGRFGRNGKLLVFKNAHKKEGEKSPDFRIYLVEWEEAKEDSEGADAAATHVPGSQQGAQDDLPF
jgi:uncharacterized protein (DUF736 family)